jgi:prepilin peptidase CpaA
MQSFVLLTWLALCAAQDTREKHIANGLTLGGGLLALVYLLWTDTTWLGAEAAQGGRRCEINDSLGFGDRR